MTAWNDATKYFRIIALSFFVYDWVITLPAEIRLYRRQRSIFHPSLACILFILVRYLGLTALLLNFGGFFSHEFREESTACEHYFRLMIITQCIASWASHAVFVVRTIAIANRDKRVTIGLVGLAVLTSGMEIFSQLFSFFKFKVGSSGNCLIQFSDDRNISWLYYLVSCIFDFVIIFMSYRRLAQKKTQTQGSYEFNDILWNSSLLYFCLTTFFNILNLAFWAGYHNSNATVLGPMGIAITSMMSARVILDVHDYANRRGSSFRSTDMRSTEKSTTGITRSVTFRTSMPPPTVPPKEYPRAVQAQSNEIQVERYRAAPWEANWAQQDPRGPREEV